MASPFELWSRATKYPMVASFAISLLIHGGLYGAYRLVPAPFLAGKGILSRVAALLGLEQSRTEERLLKELKQSVEQKLLEQLLAREIPMEFVEVDPALAVAEPPKEAKYYSTHNSVAANPKPRTESKQPKIDGSQTKLVRLKDNPKPGPKLNPQPLQPTPPQPEPQHAATPPKEAPKRDKPQPKIEPAQPPERLPEPLDMRPLGGETIGDLAMAKPQPTELPNKTAGAGAQSPPQPPASPEPPRPAWVRPRTLAQAYQQNPGLAGKTLNQDGGVKNRGHLAMVDARASLFGAYDYEFIKAVEERWYQLLDNISFGHAQQGKVVLDFRLRFDGRITDLSVNNNTVGELLCLLCQRAVLDPAPYRKWPPDMRQTIGTDFRDVRFTFYYD